MLNLLREKQGHGIFEILKSEDNLISYETNSKRKVKCYKEGGKYKFIIDLKFTGEIVNNTLYENIKENPKLQKEFETDIKSKIKKDCENFIEKMQKEYKIDMLNLGSLAAAKYGRHTGVDWNQVISDSDIEVNVTVKVDKNGRGNY